LKHALGDFAVRHRGSGFEFLTKMSIHRRDGDADHPGDVGLARKRRRVCAIEYSDLPLFGLRLQLAFKLVEEAYSRHLS
jgi:hypothetical protein